MFRLVTQKRFDQAVLQLESENVCLSKHNEGLQARIRLGEEYRERLLFENKSVKVQNRELLLRIDELENKIHTLESDVGKIEYKLREERLLRQSMEASWGRSAEA